MKKWILFFYLFCNNFQVTFAQREINFASENLDSVLKVSAISQKPTLLMIYAVWCTHCNKVKNTVFKDSNIIQFVNRNYECIQLNGEKPEGRKVMSKYRSRSFPSFLVLHPNGELLYSITGEQTNESFMTEMKAALTPENQIPYLKKLYYADSSNSEKCFNYLNTLKKGVYRDLIPNITKSYLTTQSDKQLLTETNWKIMFMGVTDIQDPYFQFIYKHREEYTKIASKKRVDNKLMNGVYSLLNDAVEHRDSLQYFSKRGLAATLKLPVIDSVLLNYDLEILAAKKAWPVYIETAIQGLPKHYMNDYSQLNNVIGNYIKYAPMNKTTDKQFLEWARQSEKLNDSYTSNYLLANIYYRLQEMDKAKSHAETAIKYAVDSGTNSNEVKQLKKLFNIE